MTEDNPLPKFFDLQPLFEWALSEPPKAKYPILNLAAMQRISGDSPLY